MSDFRRVVGWILFGHHCTPAAIADEDGEVMESHAIDFEEHGLWAMVAGALIFLVVQPALFLLGTVGLVAFSYPAGFFALSPGGQYLRLLTAQLSTVTLGLVFGSVEAPQPVLPIWQTVFTVVFMVLTGAAVILIPWGAYRIKENVQTYRDRREELSNCE